MAISWGLGFLHCNGERRHRRRERRGSARHTGRAAARKLGRVTLRLQDSLTGELRDFVPVTPGKVGIYVCGLTTQAPPHLGHVRFAVAFDVLRRWLTRGHGYDVTFIRNVTDIDDKILAKSAESGEAWYAVSYRNEVETSAALAALAVLPPTYEPRATGHIPEMVDLMETLVERDHAYPAADGSGDVYFDVQSWPAYGSLTKQKITDMAAAEDADPRGKRDPRDFALWKGRKDDEPATASWRTPFGTGRPGWHLECSAMARKYLGDTFDIHGGGVDLRFPHHENELAQSTAAGLGFANYWLHNGWVTMAGEKMSKSLGNSLRVSTVLSEHRPLVVRYYLTAAHYRSMIEYQETSLAEAAAAVERLEGFVRRALTPAAINAYAAGSAPERAFPEEFRESLDDDLGVSGALAVIHDTIRAGNTHLDEGDVEEAQAAAYDVLAMTDVLGINPLDPIWGGGDGGSSAALAALDVLVADRVAARASARAARDWASADAIRDQLAEAGVLLEDTAAGARWSLKSRGEH